MMYLVNSDNPAAINLAKNLSESSHIEGAIIPCSKAEMDCYGSDDFQAINLNDISTSLVTVYPGSSYICFADNETSIADIVTTASHLDIEIGIIRVDK